MSTIPHAAVDAALEDTLDLVAGCRRQVNTAHADVWEHVAFFCDAAAAKEAEQPASGFVHAWPYGGPGTPDVPEEAVVEIAAELGESREGGAHLVSVSMNLAHRLLRVRAAVECGAVDWRKAQMVASATVGLPVQVVADVQDLLIPDGADPETSLLARITRRRLGDVIAQVETTVDEQTVTDDVEAALAARDVSIGHGRELGVTEITGTLSVEGGARLASRVRQVARWLREAGDTRSAGVRRSVALEMLADPALVADLRDRLRRDRAVARATGTDTRVEQDSDLDSYGDVPGLPGTRPSTAPPRPTPAPRCDKTFNGWTVQQTVPGTWVWPSPTHRHYLVTAGTTARVELGVPRPARPSR